MTAVIVAPGGGYRALSMNKEGRAPANYLNTLGIAAYTDSGVIGYPSRATATKGRKTLDHLGRNAETLLNILTAAQ